MSRNASEKCLTKKKEREGREGGGYKREKKICKTKGFCCDSSIQAVPAAVQIHMKTGYMNPVKHALLTHNQKAMHESL